MTQTTPKLFLAIHVYRFFSFLLLAVSIYALLGAGLIRIGIALGSWVLGCALLIHGESRYIRNRQGQIVFDRRKTVMNLGWRLRWDRECLCEGVVITGARGSGKSTSACNGCFISLLKRNPDMGCLVIADKENSAQSVTAIAAKYGKPPEKIIVLTVSTDPDFEPPHRYNLMSNNTVPFSKRSRLIVDSALAQQSHMKEHDFFVTQADNAIGMGLELLQAVGKPVGIKAVHDMFLSMGSLKEICDKAIEGPTTVRVHEIVEYFESFFLKSEAPQQLEGVRGTLMNFTSAFAHEAIARCFSSDLPNTFDFDQALDDGCVICLRIPSDFQAERRQIAAIVKLLFYQHALRRFDISDPEKLWTKNLILLLIDEYQNCVTSSANGMSDLVIDRLRECHAAVIVATQSSTSLIPPFGSRDKRDVMLLNSLTRIIFKSPDERDAQFHAESIGKKQRRKHTTGTNMGRLYSRRKRLRSSRLVLPSYDRSKRAPQSSCIPENEIQ